MKNEPWRPNAHYGLPRVKHILELGFPGLHSLQVELTDGQSERYCTEPERVILELVQATAEQWWEWRQREGLPNCSAKTARGHACRGRVPGVFLRTPKEWADYGGGYCVMHGGATA